MLTNIWSQLRQPHWSTVYLSQTDDTESNNVHKSLYYQHLYNNGVVRHHCVQALLNYTEMMTAAALEGCSIREEEESSQCVPRWELQHWDSLAKDIHGRDDALPCSIIMTSQDTLHVHRTLAIKQRLHTGEKPDALHNYLAISYIGRFLRYLLKSMQISYECSWVPVFPFQNSLHLKEKPRVRQG